MRFNFIITYNFTIRDFKASLKANDNFISSFPGTKFREESMYVKFNSMYEIAINSIEFKKKERLNELKDYMKLILDYYPETMFYEDLEKKNNSSLACYSGENLLVNGWVKEAIAMPFTDQKKGLFTRLFEVFN